MCEERQNGVSQQGLRQHSRRSNTQYGLVKQAAVTTYYCKYLTTSDAFAVGLMI